MLFKDEAKIRLSEISPEVKKRWNLVSKTKADLREIDNLLDDIKCLRVINIFTNSTEEEYDALHEKLKEKKKVSPNLNNFFTVYFSPTESPEEVAKRLKKLPFVEDAYHVEKAIPPDQIPYDFEYEMELCRFMAMVGPCTISAIVQNFFLDSPLNEPLVGNKDTVYTIDTNLNLENQWYIFRCNADAAWPIATGRGVIIADIDWGYRTTHEELTSRLDMNHAHNSYDGGSSVNNGTAVYHGTAVMGLAGADDNGKGMIGFAFNSTLWPIQANTGPGTAQTGNSWANAIDWVRSQTTNSRKVIILEVQTGSFRNYESVSSVNAAIINAIADGVVVCVAAGNGNKDAGVDSSGNAINFTGSIVVGATSYNASTNPRESSSNWGSRVDVAAPGDPSHDLTCSNSADDAYRNGFGRTSGATPKVAGTVAMILECDPDLTPEEVRDIIRDTANQNVVTATGKPVGGFLDSYAAVKKACRIFEPCLQKLVVDQCRFMRVMDACTQKRIVETCLKSNIILDPCRLKMVVGEACVRDRIVIGPCCIRELIAGKPFWHDDIFKNWEIAFKNLKDETMKHFKRLTNRS